MVDLGDCGRVWPDRIVDLVRAAAEMEGPRVVGLGANLACYGGVIPSAKNMELLISVGCLPKASGLALDLISGSNSSSLPLLASGRMPKEINHFRIGEAIVLGRNVLDRSPWQGTRQDTLRIVAEVIELEETFGADWGAGTGCVWQRTGVCRSRHSQTGHSQYWPSGCSC